MNKWDKTVDVLTKSVYNTIRTILDRLSVFASAAVPAVLLGYSLAQAIRVMGMDEKTAATVGALAAIGLEGYGFKALRVRFEQPDNDDLKMKAYVYLLTAVLLLWSDAAIVYAMSGSIGGLVPAVIGSGFAFLSYNYYAIAGIERAMRAEKRQTAVASASSDDERREESAHRRQLERERLAWQREQEALAAQLSHDEKLADIEAKKQSRISAAQARATAVSAMPLAPRSAQDSTAGSAVQSSNAVSEAHLAHMKQLYERYNGSGEFTTADAVDALGLSPKGTGNVLATAVEVGVLERKKRGIYRTNGISPHDL